MSAEAKSTKRAVALQIADPAQFEAHVLITENDIFPLRWAESRCILDAVESKTYRLKLPYTPTQRYLRGSQL
jgi:hypothetical protein